MGGPTLDEIIGRLAVFDGRRVTASRLSGGHMNEVFLVLADDEKYVLHVAAPSGDGLVPDRSVVLRNTEAAGATGAAPRLVDRLDDPPVMVVAYVEGEMMTPERLAPAEQVPRVAEVLRRLHAGPRFGNDIGSPPRSGGSASATNAASRSPKGCARRCPRYGRRRERSRTGPWRPCRPTTIWPPTT